MAQNQEISTKAQTKREQFVWLEYVKAIALIWIFVNHLAEQLFGYPLIANPNADWPPLADRIQQLTPFTGYGILDIPLNLLRYIGWSGDQGVQLFLIVSGFGLTWGLLTLGVQGGLSLKHFYGRRLSRIYPLWIGAHLFFVVTVLLIGWGIWPYNTSLYWSAAGLRVTPNLLYFFNPSWWYFTLLLQLYLVFPLLWIGLQRLGPRRLLILGCIGSFVVRVLGILLIERVAPSYLDLWLRGGIFITRLPEFLLGMCLAAWMFQSTEATDQWLRSNRTTLAAIVVYIVGTLLSLDLFGMTVAPFLLGLGAFLILYRLIGGVSRVMPTQNNPLLWIGQHSYSLYLLHQSFILLLVPASLTQDNGLRVIVTTLMAIALTLAAAVFLERAVDWAVSTLTGWYRRGTPQLGLRTGLLGAVIVVLLLGADVLANQLSPQEVLGWGEKPALRPHEQFGWQLIPSKTTRLRWSSYDYVVTANELGFPGPAYSEEKPDGTFRILVTGDAFSSAEGVDTDLAWPRLLEDTLSQQLPDKNIEVMNFAITGYGPNQYAAIVESFAPTYRPDLIIVEFFVNDFQDVMWSDDDFRDSIGFQLSERDALKSTLLLLHWRTFIEVNVHERLVTELIETQPNPHGYLLGNFASMEINFPNLEASQQQIAARLEQMKAVAEQLQAPLLVIMVPASVQVCQPSELAYYPRFLDLNDSARFDIEQPQRLMKALANSAQLDFYDLRPVLENVQEGCPYQPNNMHWLPTGHREVASYMTETLLSEGYLSP